MRKHFDFYGYNAPTCGKYYMDDEVYTLGEDFRSVKRYKEYKNIGFNICLLQLSVKTPKYPVMVSELKNGNSRMFMVQNIGNTIDELMYNKRATTLEIDLGELAGKAKFYYRGKLVERTLDGTVLKEKLGIGQAIFIEVK